MAFVIVSGLQRTALFFISLLGVGEGGGAEPYTEAKRRVSLLRQFEHGASRACAGNGVSRGRCVSSAVSVWRDQDGTPPG